MNYQELNELLGNKDKKKYGNNRWVVRTSKGIGYQLHDTIVALFTSDGKVTLNNGGWFSLTSKKAINEALCGTQFRIRQVKGVWFLSGVNCEHEFSNNETIKI